MATITFDTLAYSQKLQKSGVPREQAEAMAQANADAIKDMLNTQELVTKKDLALALAQIQHDLEIKLANTRHEILKWMVTAMIAQTALLVGIIAFLK